MARSLAFAIHSLNPWGGHDRSTLEIARRLSAKIPVEVYSYAIEGTSWKPHRFHQVMPFLRRPAILLFIYFQLASIYFFRIRPKICRKPLPLVHSTGTCSLFMDIVQVQFVNKAWKKKLSEISEALYQLPGSRGGNLSRRWLRATYQNFLLKFNCYVEEAVYDSKKIYIAISHSVADELKQNFGIPVEKIRIIHHGVDSKQFFPSPEDRESLRKTLGLSESTVILLFVGEFERKGLAVTIEALGKVRHHDFYLMIVGNGQREGFIAQAVDLGIGNKVHFAGHIKNVEQFYRMSDIFVLPTLYEPFGLVVLEAMASGLACVVSRCAGASELIVSGESGELINDPENATEVSQLIESLLKDPERRGKMGLLARKSAELRSWDKVAEEYYELLQPMLVEPDV